MGYIKSGNEMTKLKDDIINHIIEIEGGYVDDPSDSGGATRYGITEAVARSYGYTGNIKKLPRELAFNIYSTMYWDKLKLDDIEEKSPKIAKELADTAINCGVGFAGRTLQDWLNVYNNNQQYWDNISVDGWVGNKTIAAFNAFWLLRADDKGEDVMLTSLNAEQVVRYKTLSKRYTKNQRFTYGWVRNRGLIGERTSFLV